MITINKSNKPYPLFIAFMVLFMFLAPEVYGEEDDTVPVRLVEIITFDDQGAPITFPHKVMFDTVSKETYLLSATGRLIVYDRKFFPVSSFGKGRGLFTPVGITVDPKGNIYVCQGTPGINSPDVSPRISVYNQAFFLVKEIIFSEVDGLQDFSPRRVAVSRDGLIYVVGVTANRSKAMDLSGAAVLSPEGKLLRWIKPLEEVFRPKEEIPENDVEKSSDGVQAENGENQDDIPEGITADLLPASSEREMEDEENKSKLYPVYVADVVIDDNGRLYLLSREVSHVYVYNAKEEFLFKFGEKGGADRKLSNPVSLAVDIPRRAIYVADYMRHTILAYEYETGKFIFEFGGRGLSPLWFNYPNDIDVDNMGRLLVADLFNRRVQVIDPNMEERRPVLNIVPKEQGLGGVPLPGERIVQIQEKEEPEFQIVEPAKLREQLPIESFATPHSVSVPEKEFATQIAKPAKLKVPEMIVPLPVTAALDVPEAIQELEMRIAEPQKLAVPKRVATLSVPPEVSVPEQKKELVMQISAPEKLSVPKVVTNLSAPPEVSVPKQTQGPDEQIAEPKKLKASSTLTSFDLPAVVSAPEVPQPLAGAPSISINSAPPTREVPSRVKSVETKGIEPVKIKKIVEPKAEVSEATEKEAIVTPTESEPIRRILKLTASVGVYGPVAALGMLGGWLLYKNK